MLLAAIALATAPMAGLAIAAPVAAATAKPLERLVALLLPEESLITLAARAFDAGLDREVANNAELRAIHARQPGFKAYVASRLRPALATMLKKELPGLRREIRAIVAAELKPREIEEALAFFASPTGAKLRTQVYATMGDNPNQSPEAMQAAAISAVMKQMKAADYPALIAFGASSAASKMNIVNPKIAAASRAWSDRLVAKNSKKMRALAAAAVRHYKAGGK